MDDDQPGQHPDYTPPPPTSPPPPLAPAPVASGPYAHPGFPTYPQAGPGYPPHYPQQYLGAPYPGYPYPGYGGYGGYVPGPRDIRPGTTMAAAVLGYIVAGFLIIAGVILLTGASLIDELSDSADARTTELAFDGFVNFIAAGLLIAGGVSLTGRKHNGRTMLFVGITLTISLGVYWLVRYDWSGSSLALFWDGIFTIPAIIAGCLAAGGATRAWLDAAPR